MKSANNLAAKLLLGSLVLLVCACGGSKSTVAPSTPADTTTKPPPPPATGSLSGFVGDEERDGVPVVGARITVAGVSTIVDQDGRFSMPTVTAGLSRATVSAVGYDTLVQDITIRAGVNAGSFPLIPVNTFIPSGDLTVYLPPGVGTFRGAFLPMYGGTADSRPMLKGDFTFYQNLAPAGDVPAYRSALRAFARDKGFAVIGMKTPLFGPTGAAMAFDIQQALVVAAGAGNHPELADAPLFLQGMSSGACLINRIVTAIPDRVIGFISMKGDPNCGPGSQTVSVPGYFFLGEFDDPAIAVSNTADFEQNRGRGAVWALAIERGVGHVWVANNQLIFNWAAAVAAQRLPATVTPGVPVALRAVGESSGWLGDRASLSIAPSACFTGDRQRASWLPTQQTARDWQSMMGSVTTVLACP